MAGPNGINGAKRHQTGPVPTSRMQAACARACDAYRSTRMIAQLAGEELDETTAPHGIPLVELHDEDSLVVVVRDALAAHDKAG